MKREKRPFFSREQLDLVYKNHTKITIRPTKNKVNMEHGNLNYSETTNSDLGTVSGSLPLAKEHQCFERGHAFYLVCEIDNGRSKYGDHKCSRCGHVEPFQYDYGD